jgi:hypothetical protein
VEVLTKLIYVVVLVGVTSGIADVVPEASRLALRRPSDNEALRMLAPELSHSHPRALLARRAAAPGQVADLEHAVYVLRALDDDQATGLAAVSHDDDLQAAAGDERKLAEVEHYEPSIGALYARELALKPRNRPTVQLPSQRDDVRVTVAVAAQPESLKIPKGVGASVAGIGHPGPPLSR